MLLNQAFSPVLSLLQEAPGVSPIILIIISILLVVLFFWVLLSGTKTDQIAMAETDEKPADGAVLVPAALSAEAADTNPETIPPAVEAVAAEAAEPAEAAVPVEPTVTPMAGETALDDLEIIEGIGPKAAGVLRQAGVTTFAQLAEMEPARILEILRAANLRLADPTSWPEQARLAAAGDHAGLRTLQDRLKGGRRVIRLVSLGQ